MSRFFIKYQRLFRILLCIALALCALINLWDYIDFGKTKDLVAAIVFGLMAIWRTADITNGYIKMTREKGLDTENAKTVEY
jgi:uncharacterized membrane protein